MSGIGYPSTSTRSASCSSCEVVASRTSSGVVGVTVTVEVGRNMSGGCPTSPKPWAVRSGVGKGLMRIAETPSGYAAEIALRRAPSCAAGG